MHWKQGKISNTTNISDINASSESGDDKTYPFIADDGSVMGYYHVGDTVDYMGNIFQLKSDGKWVVIAESKGSSDNVYAKGYNDALDDSKEYDVESSCDSSSDSDSSDVEPSTDSDY